VLRVKKGGLKNIDERTKHDIVNPIVAASWDRCLMGGMDPNQKPVLVRLTGKELENRLKASLSMARVAHPFMERIASFVSSDLAVFLSDSEGCMVSIIGEARLSLLPPVTLEVGTVWSEQQQGTNAVSLVLDEKKPCQITGVEHYLKAYHGLAGAAAPILSSEGAFLGILGVVGPKEAFHMHTLGMVVASSAAIENQLELERTTEQLYSVVQAMSDGLIAIDNDGIITHMNHVAGRIFGLKPMACIGQRADEIFRDSLPLLQVIKCAREGFSDRELSVMLNGRRVHVTLTSRPICSQQGQIFGVVLTCREMKSVQRLVTRMVGAQARFTFSDLVGEDPTFCERIEMARRVARSDSTVLLSGESGTGKELFAQAIHNASPRRDGPFVAVNSAALPRDLVESELFGYEEGAFTGARRGGRPGKFELASGGTLFLDEIGDIPLETQISLLRVLQDKQVVRIGGHTPIPVQIRVIAATNKDIVRLVKEGHFRLDLYYRLSVVNVVIPPLRDRGEDVLLLAEHFLRRFARQRGLDRIEMTPEVKAALMRYAWPGNVRELENAIEQANHLLEGSILELRHLPGRISGEPGQRTDPPCLPMNMSSWGGGIRSLDEVERDAIINAVALSEGNVSSAAKRLGVGRTTLYRKLEKYDIDLKSLRKASS
jgi:PAS domain S-box-containing protein